MKRILLSIATAFCVSASAAQNANQPADASLSDYIYTAPPGWTPTSYADGILLNSPVSDTGEKCVIGLLPMQPSSGDLFQDASAAWARVFRAFEVRATSTFPSMPLLIRGTSAQGWEYVMVKRGIALRGTPVDPLNEQQFLGFIMVAKLGNRLAAVSGLSADPLVSSCFGSSLGDVWPRFFSTLQFKNWTPLAGSGFAQKIRGIWMSVSTNIGSGTAHRYVFTPAGRYSEVGVMQRYMGLSRTETAVWTSKTFGDGSYSIRGNQITFTPDRGKPDVGYLRLEQVSENGGKTWVEKLYILTASTLDDSCAPFRCANAEGEVGYERLNE